MKATGNTSQDNTSGGTGLPGETTLPGEPAQAEPDGRIRLLSEGLINQIAAGEVVERPASVCKELLENALDAGATRITVQVEGGGREAITVLDNGVGMGPEDALLSVQRHATSKLRTAEELARVATLGFRGEALASIAAVARFELSTCADERQGGTRLRLEGGVLKEQGRVGFPRGTRIRVEELFFNTPARRKFLRAESTEFQHLQGAFLRCALVRPDVHFRLSHNGRAVQELPPCPTLAERARQLFGKGPQGEWMAVEGGEPRVRFEGLISHPSHSRASRRWQYLFINGRAVREAGVNHAVYQGYRTLLMKGRHPAYVLLLHLDPDEVDVNVHPAKSEVRLRNGRLVHSVLSGGIYRALMQTARRQMFGEAVVQGDVEDVAGITGAPGTHPGQGGLFAGQAEGGQGAHGGGAYSTGAQGPHGGRAPLEPPGGVPTSAFPDQPPPTVGDNTGGSLTGHGAATTPGARVRGELLPNPLDGGAFSFQPLTPLPPRVAGGAPGFAQTPLVEAGLGLLGQFHSTYILAQKGNELLLIDQHAAHERILFEQYRTQYYGGAMHAERYLLPLNLELSPQNALLLEQYLEQWRGLGFDMEPFGRNAFKVNAVPALLAGKDIESLILSVLDELALFGKSGRIEEAVNGILERVACHAAIRAGMVLGMEEMRGILEGLEGLDINLYCPHGRPVWVAIGQHELEKRFKRIV